MPLLAGLAELTWFVVVGRPRDDRRPDLRPSPARHPDHHGRAGHRRAVADHGRRPADGPAGRTGRLRCIAGRRLADNPRAGFRAISGLVLALFVAQRRGRDHHHDRRLRGGRRASRRPAGRRCSRTSADFSTAAADVARSPACRARSLTRLRAIPGVHAPSWRSTPSRPPTMLPRRGSPAPTSPPSRVSALPARRPAVRIDRGIAGLALLAPHVACRRAGDRRAAGRAAGADRRRRHRRVGGGDRAGPHRARDGCRRPTPGSRPGRSPSRTRDRGNVGSTRQYRQLADVVILTSLPIAGCTPRGERRRRAQRPPAPVRPAAADRRARWARCAGSSSWRAPFRSWSAPPSPSVSGSSPPGCSCVPSWATRCRRRGAATTWSWPRGCWSPLAVLASTLPVLRRITDPETARFE